MRTSVPDTARASARAVCPAPAVRGWRPKRPRPRQSARRSRRKTSGWSAVRPARSRICVRHDVPVARTAASGGLAPHRRQQRALGDRHARRVVLGLVAEDARHAAAAGVEHLERRGRARRAGRARLRVEAGDGALVAVRVQDGRPPAVKRSRPAAASSATSAWPRRAAPATSATRSSPGSRRAQSSAAMEWQLGSTKATARPAAACGVSAASAAAAARRALSI